MAEKKQIDAGDVLTRSNWSDDDTVTVVAVHEHNSTFETLPSDIDWKMIHDRELVLEPSQYHSGGNYEWHKVGTADPAFLYHAKLAEYDRRRRGLRGLLEMQQELLREMIELHSQGVRVPIAKPFR